MAEILTITDGSTPISLLNTSGFEVTAWTPKMGTPDGDLSETLTEVITLKLTFSDQNDAASQLQAFSKLRKRAEQYHTTTWQTTPIYLEKKGDTETGTRRALIRSATMPDHPDIQSMLVKTNKKMTDLVLTLVRENWTDKVPGAYPSAETLTQAATDGPATPTRVHIGNTFDEISVPTYIFNDDGAVFNDISGSSSAALFSDSGNIQAGDTLYFGFDNPGHNIVMDLLMSAGVSINVSYAYGSSPSIATVGNGKLKLYPIDGSVFVDVNSDSVKVIGIQASDWDTSTIDGQLAYWLRITVDSIISAGTITLQNNQPYCPNVNKIRIPNTVTDGDLPSHTLLAFASGEGDGTPAFSAYSRILMCLNSQNVDLYDSLIPARDISFHKDNWTPSNGTDASNDDDDPLSIGGKSVAVSFSGDETLVNRLMIQGAANNVDKAYYGKHRAFILCEQVGGAVGDLSVQIEIIMGGSIPSPVGHILTEEKDLRAFDEGTELVDMGIIDIPGVPFVANDDITSNTLFFRVLAARSTGSATLSIRGIAIFRTSEWFGVLNSPIIATDNKSASLNKFITIEMDSGVVRKRVLRAYNDDQMTTLANNQLVGPWELHSNYPKMEPATEYDMHFLFLRYDSAAFGTGPMFADVAASAVMELRVTDRYSGVRGAD